MGFHNQNTPGRFIEASRGVLPELCRASYQYILITPHGDLKRSHWRAGRSEWRMLITSHGDLKQETLVVNEQIAELITPHGDLKQSLIIIKVNNGKASLPLMGI